MGLDNGIIFRSNKELHVNCYCEDWSHIDKFKYNYEYEIIYFRKCYNVRSDIISILHPMEGHDYRFQVSSNDIISIIDILEGYNEETWDSDESIWSWEESKDLVKNYIDNLKLFYPIIKELEDNGERFECYFYDSY